MPIEMGGVWLLSIMLCFGGRHGCNVTRPTLWPTHRACERAAETMTAHAGDVARGEVSASCSTMGESRDE